MTPSQRSVSLRFGAITVLLVVAGFLFPATKGEAFVVGVGVGLALVWLFGVALRMEGEGS